jgi:hypothetical protein
VLKDIRINNMFNADGNFFQKVYSRVKSVNKKNTTMWCFSGKQISFFNKSDADFDRWPVESSAREVRYGPI